MMCERCGAANTGQFVFCHKCGRALGAQEDIECDTHAGEPAMGICMVCGKPVCGDCSVTAHGRIYCDDASHVSVDTTCVVFGTSATVFDAELISRNLNANGVEVHIFSPGSFFPYVSMSDDFRPKIYVETDRRNTAVSLVEDLDLHDFITLIVPS